jgi:hypothetical protein
VEDRRLKLGAECLFRYPDGTPQLSRAPTQLGWTCLNDFGLDAPKAQSHVLLLGDSGELGLVIRD